MLNAPLPPSQAPVAVAVLSQGVPLTGKMLLGKGFHTVVVRLALAALEEADDAEELATEDVEALEAEDAAALEDDETSDTLEEDEAADEALELTELAEEALDPCALLEAEEEMEEEELSEPSLPPPQAASMRLRKKEPITVLTACRIDESLSRMCPRKNCRKDVVQFT